MRASATGELSAPFEILTWKATERPPSCSRTSMTELTTPFVLSVFSAAISDDTVSVWRDHPRNSSVSIPPPSPVMASDATASVTTMRSFWASPVSWTSSPSATRIRQPG